MADNKLQEKRDLDLLRNHLNNLHIKTGKAKSIEQAEKITKKMMIAHKDNIWGKEGLAVWLGRQSISFFCLYFLQNIFVASDNNTARELSQLHFDLWNELSEMFIEDKWDKEEFILPRGSSKSTTINKALTCYLHCYKLSRYSLVIGKTKTDAQDFIEDIKKFMGFEQIKKSFGNLIDKKNRTVNAQEFELTNDTLIRAYGWETSVRGTSYSAPDGIFRPTLVIMDDILNENDIKTDNAKENALNKYYKEIAEVGDEAVYRNGKKVKLATKFIVLGTPLAQDCFINTIRKEPTFVVFRRSVLDFNIDEYMEENEYWQHYKKILFNTKLNDKERKVILEDYYLENIENMKFPTIWNDKYRCDKLANRYFSERTAFLQELMCDCENVGEKWFKSMRKMSVKEIESNKFKKTCLVVDPASTVSKRSDYSAFVVGSVAENGFKYVRKGIIDKLVFEDYCNNVIELLKEYKDITHIIIERNTYQTADVTKIKELINQDKELSKRRFEFINKPQTRNKDEKISTIIDSVNSGSIIFNEEDEEFNNSFMDFSGQLTSLHDDSNDAVAEFAIKIDEIKATIGSIVICNLKSLGL